MVNNLKLARPFVHWFRELLSNYMPSKFRIALRGIGSDNIPFQDNDTEIIVTVTPTFNPADGCIHMRLLMNVRFKYDCYKITSFITPLELYGEPVTASEFECETKIIPRGKFNPDREYFIKDKWYTIDLYHKLKYSPDLCKPRQQ